MMGIIENAGDIAQTLLNSDDIIISAHTGPDGDAIGSVCALFIALKKLGKNVAAVLEVLPGKYGEIKGVENIVFEIPTDFNIKTFIALDCGDKARLGRFENYFDSAPVRINIDHHASNNCFGTVNFVDKHASSTSEIVYEILCSNNAFTINKEIASALYAGILYDTGGFRHPSTTSQTYYAAGKLIDFGADFNAIYKKVFREKRFEEIKILIVAFDKMKREADGKIVWTSVLSEELKRAKAKSSDLDNVVDYCMSVQGAKIAIFIYQKNENEFKISLRSEPGYDVSVIAAKLGGGGHKNAAGATYCGTFDKCAEEVLKEAEKAIGV